MEKPHFLISLLAFIIILAGIGVYEYTSCAGKQVCDANLTAKDTPVCTAIMIVSLIPIIPAFIILWLFYTPAGKAKLTDDFSRMLRARWIIGMTVYALLYCGFLVYLRFILC